jgi:hypothetical protein
MYPNNKRAFSIPPHRVTVLARYVAAHVVEEQFAENIKVIVNLNAFTILAENKRVDIAIVAIAFVDNIIKL